MWWWGGRRVWDWVCPMSTCRFRSIVLDELRIVECRKLSAARETGNDLLTPIRFGYRYFKIGLLVSRSCLGRYWDSWIVLLFFLQRIFLPILTQHPGREPGEIITRVLNVSLSPPFGFGPGSWPEITVHKTDQSARLVSCINACATWWLRWNSK